MRMIVASVFILYFAGFQSIEASYEIDFESGLAFTGYNDVKIPGNTGTLFSLKDDLSPQTSFFLRFRATGRFGERHVLSFLAAPLKIRSEGRLDRHLNYEGYIFEAGDLIKADYRFDSYRLTYRYEFYDRARFSAGAGITGKIRDAEIRLNDGSKSVSKKNTGFVPLINFSFRYRLGKNLTIIADGDALAAPQGRAEDVFFGAIFSLSPVIDLKAGYRILEGGADNDEVYNFTLVNYISFGVIIGI
ncbi:hypothetical protein JW890_00400 [candidate division WOR-3 bacterium]|nr:hypothetical protein [candidate division WOR-3 bacterium]